MPVHSIDGTRPIDSTSTVANQTPRTAVEVKKREEGEEKRAEPVDEAPKSSPSSLFKPFSLSFRFDEELNRVVVKVIDPETGESLREIPPEAVLETLRRLRSAPGSLVDEEA